MSNIDLFQHIKNASAGLVPIEFLIKFSNPFPKSYTDNLSHEIVPVEVLWNELITVGMRHPLNLRICIKEKTVRLETGNQRIRLFQKYDVHHIPTTIEIAETPIGNPGNGLQVYPLLETDFNLLALQNLKTQFCQPRDVINPLILI